MDGVIWHCRIILRYVDDFNVACLVVELILFFCSVHFWSKVSFVKVNNFHFTKV